MNARELNQQLSRRVEDVAQMLLPGGRRKGNEWEAGDLDGKPGDSLKVHLVGAKAGVWSDFATGEKGDLLGLWIKAKGVTLKEAMTQAKDYLGVRDDFPFPKTAKAFKRPMSPDNWSGEGKVACISSRAVNLIPRRSQPIRWPPIRPILRSSSPTTGTTSC